LLYKLSMMWRLSVKIVQVSNTWFNWWLLSTFVLHRKISRGFLYLIMLNFDGACSQYPTWINKISWLGQWECTLKSPWGLLRICKISSYWNKEHRTFVKILSIILPKLSSQFTKPRKSSNQIEVGTLPKFGKVNIW
jgi:hypothetical protein